MQLVSANPVDDPLVVQVYCGKKPIVLKVDNQMFNVLSGLNCTFSDGLAGHYDAAVVRDVVNDVSEEKNEQIEQAGEAIAELWSNLL